LNRKVYIYGLLEIGTEEIRYIGKSVNPLKRFREHKRLIKSKRINKLKSWLMSIDNQVTIKIIETTDENNWEEREKYWIKYYRDNNYNLCNIQDGGIEIPTSYNKLDKKYKDQIRKKLKNNKPPSRKGAKMPESALKITLKNLKDKKQAILLYDINKKFIKEFVSMIEAKNYLGCNNTANISRCCKNNKIKGCLHHKYYNHYIIYK